MKKILSEISIVFCLVIFCFVLASSSVFASCSYDCGLFGWSTCYTDVGKSRCIGDYLKKCNASSEWENTMVCSSSIVGNWDMLDGRCVNDDANSSAYCGCSYKVWSGVGGGGWYWGLETWPPVGYSNNYEDSVYNIAADSLLKTPAMKLLCVSNYNSSSSNALPQPNKILTGNWRREDDNTSCDNNYQSLARSGDCRFLIENSNTCEWSPSENKCVKESAAPNTCSNSSNYCAGVAFPNSGGTYSNPTCTGTKTCGSGYTCLNNSCVSVVNGSCGTTLNSCLGGVSGTAAGSEKCVDRYGVCQTDGDSLPTLGSWCSVNNGVSGTYQSGYCGGIYDAAYRCCVPSSGAGAAGDSVWMCRGVNGGSNATCSCPAAVNCPSTCHTNTTYVSNGSCGTTTCLPNAPAAGTPSVCRTAAQTLPNGSCGTTTYAANCTSTCIGNICDAPPTVFSFDIRNINGSSVGAETGRNHICQSTFVGTTSPTTARFVVTYSDVQGGADIGQIRLQLGTQIFTDSSLVVSGNNATATFDIPKSSITSSDLQNITTSASDATVYTGSVTAFADTGRDFKYWDCNVPVSGTIYDGSDVSPPEAIECSAPTGFSKPVGSINFTDLTFKNISGNESMTINSPNYSSGANYLTWGKTYTFSFNPDIGLNTAGVKMKLNDKAPCSSDVNLTNNTIVDPYVNNPSLDADFAAVVDQDPWWQAISGGVVSNGEIKNQVPVTCITNNCKVSVDGFVSSPKFYNIGKENSNSQVLSYSAKLANVNNNYGYFYDQYYVKNGIGTTLIGNKNITDIGGTGIYFISGDLTIDSNKTISSGDFLMLIVKGDITVTQNTTRVDGILVANNIYATGLSDAKLNFNGSIFASKNISLTRGYNVKVTNNINPSVVVNYKPELLFKLPGIVAKSLTNFRWGN